MDFEIVELPKPAVGEEPHALTRAYHSYSEVFDSAEYGHDDFSQPFDTWAADWADESSSRSERWLALRAGTDHANAIADDVLGTALTEFYLREDLDKAGIHVMVRHDVRSQGIGRALYRVAERAVLEDGRTTAIAWPNTKIVEKDSPDAHVAVTGVGAVDRRAASSTWLAAEGWQLSQVENYSILRIPPQGGTRDEWVAEMRTHAEGAAAFAGEDYELLIFSGALPEEHHERMAELYRRMSVDIPSGGMDWDEEDWDAERVAQGEKRFLKPGRRRLVALIRHVPSGDLVAFSIINWNEGNAPAIYQYDTFVHGEHRGHRLGLWMKAANHVRLLEENPNAERIHTWNAAENEHMLAVNYALGYEGFQVQGLWQRDLTASGERKD